MNRLMLFTEIVKKAQLNKDYYIWGKPIQIGIIEELLTYFGIEYNIESHSESMHQKNLELLKQHILNRATDEQLKMIYDVVKHNEIVPQSNLDIVNSGKVFVSMPMNKNKCNDVDTIREGIERGIIDSGNEAYYLDLDTHNENIFNKMMNEIIGCKFLVADFTSQNAGVYYEAGYAKALGKTVIYTCKDSDFDNVHFDIKQTQFVVWKNVDDLSEKLLSHIIGANLGK